MSAWKRNDQDSDSAVTLAPDDTLEMEHLRSGSLARVVSITSGKGGVGKSSTVVNLAYTFAKAGRKVLVLDADLGLANLDVLLGLTPRYNLQHVLEGERELADVIVNGPGGFSIIPAASGAEELTRLSPEDKTMVLSEIVGFADDYDLMLLDTAAGITSNVLFFNLMAHQVLVLLTPEPTSMTDAYAVMKVLSLRHARQNFILVVNSAKSASEANEIFTRLQLVADRFLDVDLTYAGHIVLDEKMVHAVRAQRPVVEMYPQSASAKCYEALADSLNTLILEP